MHCSRRSFYCTDVVQSQQSITTLLLWKSLEARAISRCKSTKPAPVSKSRPKKPSLFFYLILYLWCFHWQKAKWHWVGVIIKGSTTFNRSRSTVRSWPELKQSGSMIIHSFNQTCLVVKMLHYYSWKMENIPKKQAKAMLFFLYKLYKVTFSCFYVNQDHQ